MTDHDRRPSPEADAADERSDIQQAVEARADALARGEGGNGASPDAPMGESGADGFVKNQEDLQQ
ncbi:hypothetical protein SAMN06297144_2337 [Sphingomonas guangdongensis]|uniref:Uncharacterized protein n=1 Tax=Sphingomonas guangdongensis TaxID=1141890 RepID=A0A285QZ91_9SPHN|nr:hypothetical protein [Sphingomonas guangdongensis]SOB87213.1 hypothetical protein SAMN06297144_2337 [Sphingomonas guangdongensis]